MWEMNEITIPLLVDQFFFSFVWVRVKTFKFIDIDMRANKYDIMETHKEKGKWLIYDLV